MTLPYDRKFTVGRQSEQFYNEELHKIYESTKHLTDTPPKNEEPKAKLHRAMWHDEAKNQLKWWDQSANKWRRYFEREFKITDSIMSVLPPDNPVPGQLWLHNGVLCYYDGMTWTPVKALLQDGSQFSLDVFKNFLLISPLWRIGNTIVEDTEIAAYKKEERKYLQGVLDGNTDSWTTGDGTKWNLSHDCSPAGVKIPELPLKGKAQMLLPNIDYARMFLEHELDTEKYEEVSKVCIQYDRNDVLNATPSLVHINPGRLTKMTKRIIKIDRDNPRIRIPAANTEYYGFHESQYFGDLLLPDQEKQEADGTFSAKAMDYTIVEDGILLSYNASQSYDYVLAITYEFSWMKTTGRMVKTNTKDATNAYYVDKFSGPFNVFVDGYNYEDPYYEADGMSQTITTKEDTRNYEVNVLHVPQREYGYIRTVNIKGQGIIRPLRKYKRPLVFCNGEALCEADGDFKVETGGRIYIEDAKDDMVWCVIDLYEEPCERNGFTTYIPKLLTGKVGADSLISYTAATVPDSETAVLFVDGLLVKKEEIIYDRVNHKIDVAGGLTPGQKFILVEDKYGWLYDEKALIPALSIGKFSDSLVYFNKHLICNNKAIDCSAEPFEPRMNPDGSITNIPYPGVFNEVKNFKAVYEEVVEVDNIAALNALVTANTGKHQTDIERDIEKNIRAANAAALLAGTMTEEEVVSKIKKEQRVKIVRNGVLYYDKTTKNGYVGVKDNNDTAYPCSYEKVFDSTDTTAVREIQRDLAGNITQITNNRYRIYNIDTDVWDPMPVVDIPKVKFFAYAYENMQRSIRLLLPYTNKDVIQTYAFNMANAIEHPLSIKSVDVNNEDEIKTVGQYVYGANSLRVWCNGIRQYPNTAPEGQPLNGIQESLDGKSFKLPEKFTGKVTYVIELPENNQTTSCSMEILDEKNLTPGYINMYKTKQPMFPGRVTLYINGIRQATDSYTVFDNYTLLINDDKPLIGTWQNYPTEKVVVGDEEFTLTHSIADKLLVEVRQDDRQEQTIQLEGHPTYDIDVEKYDLPLELLEAADEIMIFADGLYFGPTLNGNEIDGGYIKNVARGCVTIRQQEILEAMNYDEEYLHLRARPYENIEYLNRHDNKPYERYNAKLTLEWR